MLIKYATRENKGTYLYIKKQRIFEIIKTIILFVMAFGIFLIGYITLGTKRSLWTVFAILAMLPACKAFVGVVMFARFKSLSYDNYEKYKQTAGDIKCLYENVLTTSKKSYYLPVLACEDNTLIGYMEAKDNKAIKEISEHIEFVLKNGGHKSCVIKIFDNEDAFLNRLGQMREKLSDDKKLSSDAIFETIKAVSL